MNYPTAVHVFCAGNMTDLTRQTILLRNLIFKNEIIQSTLTEVQQNRLVGLLGEFVVNFRLVKRSKDGGGDDLVKPSTMKGYLCTIQRIFKEHFTTIAINIFKIKPLMTIKATDK